MATALAKFPDKTSVFVRLVLFQDKSEINLLEIHSVNIGYVIVRVGFPLIRLELGNPLETVVSVVAVVARRVGP